MGCAFSAVFSAMFMNITVVLHEYDDQTLKILNVTDEIGLAVGFVCSALFAVKGCSLSHCKHL